MDPHARYCDLVELEIAAFVRAVDGVDPALPVPTCPGWTVADLVRHHGTTHRWIDRIVSNRLLERIWSRDVAADGPDDPAGYPQWLAAGGAAVVATLRATDPDTPVWTVLGTDRRVAFWPRRLLFEAVVHRADVELALSSAPAVDAALAADGIDEFLGFLPSAHWVAERLGDLGWPGDSLHVHTTDVAGEWMISVAPLKVERAHGKGTAALRGPARDLLLVLYRRLPLDGSAVEVFGDRKLADDWLARTAF